MIFAFTRASLVAASLIAATGWPRAANAQSHDQLLEQAREACRAQFTFLKGPEKKDHVHECVVAKMRGGPELGSMFQNVDNLIEQGRLAEAEAAARSAIAKATAAAGPNSIPAGRGYHYLAMAYSRMANYKAAEPAARQALSILEASAGVDALPTNGGRITLGSVLLSLNRLREAEGYLNRAVQTAGSGRHTTMALIQLSRLRADEGRLDESEKIAQRAVSEAEKFRGPGSGDTVYALDRLGLATMMSGRYAESEAYLQRALAIGESELGSHHWLLGMVLRDLGGMYGSTGRLKESEGILQRAIENLKKSTGPEYRPTLVAMLMLARTYLDDGRAQDAETTAREALKASEKNLGAEHGDNIYMHKVIGRSLQEQGRLQEAEAELKRAIAIADSPGMSVTEGRRAGPIFGDLGQLYIEQRRFAEARETLETAQTRTTAALGPDHPSTLAITAALAGLDDETGNLAEALAKLKRVVSALAPRMQGSGELTSERYSNDVGPAFRRRVAAGLATIAWRLDEQQGTDRSRPDDALAAAQLVMDSSAASAIGQMATRFAATDDALGLLVRQGQDLLHSWQTLNRQVVAGVSDNSIDADRREEMRVELDRIATDLEKVDRRLAKEFPQYAELARPGALSIDDVQKLLAPDESLVTFLIGKNESFVWAIVQSDFIWRRIPLGAEQLTDKVARLRKGLDIDELQAGIEAGRPELFDLEVAHEVYQDLLAPLEGLVAGKRDLIIVPSGALTSLPFHLLVTEAPAARITDLKQVGDYRNAAWLINRHAITILPSVTSLKALRLLARAPTGERALVGFGDPRFGKDKSEDAASVQGGAGSRRLRAYNAYWKGGSIDYSLLSRSLPPLPETADELKAVASTLGAARDDIYLGAAASETAVKAGHLDLYRVVYFATHGLVAGDIQGLAEPALALATPATPSEADDGLLTASEVARLKLNADWVVLSACNTAAGDKAGAEAFSGLARAFFYAGARAILVSHWPVDSAAAVQLTTRAFDALQQPGTGRAEALRQSVLAYMSDPTDPLNAYPAYWGPFAVVGEGGP